MTSLRNTVMLYVTILLVVVGIAAASTSYYFVRREVNSFQDNALEQVALTAGLTFRHDIEPRVDPELEDQLVVQIWNRSGKSVYQSGPQADIPFQQDPGYFDVTADGERWRVFRAQDAEYALQISQRWSAREEVAANAAAGAAIPLAAAVPVAWLLIGWAVNRVLRGLGKLSSEIGARGASATQPLDTSDLPREIAPVVTAMNSLIERLHAALETQRRFVADAAHELRTPLAALQIQTDNLEHRDLPSDARPVVSDLRSGVTRASYMVSQLLILARADAPAREEPRVIDLRSEIQGVIEDFVIMAGARGVGLALDVPDAIVITTRPHDIGLILSILLDNALRFASKDGHGDIVVAARRRDDYAIIKVSDNGCGIPEAALSQVFDRFFRAAPSETEGTGLGLSIAKAAADRNGIALSVVNRTDGPGVTASILIPAVSTAT